VKNETGRAFDAPPVRPDRVRCVHCGMPVRGSVADCWSCGLPALDETAKPQPVAEVVAAKGPARPTDVRIVRVLILAVGAAAAVAIVLVTVALLVPADRGSTLHRFADKVRGDGWERLETSAFTVDLPGKPVESVWTPAASHPKPGQTWKGSASGVAAEVSVASVGDPSAPIEGREEARKLLEGLAAERGGKVSDVQAVTMLGAVGLDATIGAAGDTQVRARGVVIAGTAHVFVVQGRREDFDRFTTSFRLTGR
jgi:hypothetical protein